MKEKNEVRDRRKKEAGRLGEELSVLMLEERGYEILERKYRCRFGEIDIIALRRDILTFVEVKTRKQDAMFSPREAVTMTKQRRLIQTASIYLSKYPSALQPRFDVIEIYAPQGTETVRPAINHMEDAFE